jgi:hypothetical protein
MKKIIPLEVKKLACEIFYLCMLATENTKKTYYFHNKFDCKWMKVNITLLRTDKGSPYRDLSDFDYDLYLEDEYSSISYEGKDKVPVKTIDLLRDIKEELIYNIEDATNKLIDLEINLLERKRENKQDND